MRAESSPRVDGRDMQDQGMPDKYRVVSRHARAVRPRPEPSEAAK
jgi:hypothetical protein